MPEENRVKVSTRFVAAIAGLGGVLSVTVASQAPAPQTPTFKAEVEYVDVDAVVTDATGAVVKDLRKEDFRIFEDGKSQSIAGFAFVEIPVVHPGAGRPTAARANLTSEATKSRLPAGSTFWSWTTSTRRPLVRFV